MAEQLQTELESVVIRFAGDSGDGNQVIGTKFSDEAALLGNDIAILPDYPAEIRAPAGSIGGVSAYQIHFSSKDIRTPGDDLDVLVAFNAAAFKTSIGDLKTGGYLFCDTSGFSAKNLKLAGYETNPLETPLVGNVRVIQDDFTTLTVNALKDTDVKGKNAKRCKNFFALGMMFWLYGYETQTTIDWLNAKFAKKPEIADANIKALNAGYSYADTIELFSESFQVKKAELEPGTYRKISGNEATAKGLIAASLISKKDIFFASYPITPASNILHDLSKEKKFMVKTFQAEDEIAAACAAIGASFAGDLGITSTSGPGLCLKSEALNLAIMAELPLVVIDVQRGGPSTGLPTKTEQSDLLQAMYGRNGDSPCIVIAAQTPADCFNAALEACKLSLEFMTPVVLLTDGYIANGAEPWKIPQIDELPGINVSYAPERSPEDEKFQSYKRDPETMARPWAIPGIKGNEHRIGGLEKQQDTGNISYDAANHEIMTHERAAKVENIKNFLPELDVLGPEQGDLLVLSWGGTYGSVATAVEQLQNEGQSIAHAHLRYLNPMPKNIKSVLKNYKKVLIAELNNGQLSVLIQGLYGVEVESYNKIQGKPFKVSELIKAFSKSLKG